MPKDKDPEAAATKDDGAGADQAPAAAPKVAKVARDCRVTYKYQTLELKAGQKVVDNDELAAFLGRNGLLAED